MLGDADTANDTLALSAAVSPADAEDQTVSFESSDTAVATVSSSGVVTAQAAGTATITVTATDGGWTDTCLVTVQQRASGVSVSPATASLTLGDADTANDTAALTAAVSPSDATETGVSWASSDTSVATVSSAGVVTAKKAGSATITATTADGGFTDSCAVTVTQKVTGLSILPTSATLILGDEDTANDTVTLSSTVSPEDADEQGVTYASSDTSVATVDVFGIVSAVKKGTAVITATSVDGSFTARCDITVENRVRLLSTSPDGKVCMGCSVTLTPTVSGGTWSYDADYLSQSGNVFTPLKPGTSVVTYSTATSSGRLNPLQKLMNLLFASASADDEDTVSYTVTAEELTLTSSLADPFVPVGGEFTLTPNFAGGSWTFDSDDLSAAGNVFTAKRTGSTRISYTFETQTADYDLTVIALPQTGDGSPSPLLYAGISLLTAAFTLALLRLRKRILHKSIRGGTRG